jgi:hypothetical protein
MNVAVHEIAPSMELTAFVTANELSIKVSYAIYHPLTSILDGGYASTPDSTYTRNVNEGYSDTEVFERVFDSNTL